MGMEIMIWPDSTSNYCQNTLFPSGLNWLFGRVREFGENSEYKQLEKLFEIDLEMFNHTNFAYDEEEGFPLDNWIIIDSMVSELKKLKTSIEDQPLFYQEIKYDGQYNSEEEWRQELMSFNKKNGRT